MGYGSGPQPNSSTGRLDAVSSKRLRKQLDSTLRMANKAQQKLQQGDDDEDTVGGITQLIEEAMGKHEQVRNEMGSHGVTMPMSTAVTDNLSSVLHAGTGQRMAMERQVGDIQEACRQLKEIVDVQQVSTFMHEADEGSSGERGFNDHSPTSPSGIRARGKGVPEDSDEDDEDESDEDDDSQHIMTPRGVYVHRCLPLTKTDLQEEGESYQAWSRMTHVNVIGLLLFVLYLAVSGAYIFFRCRDSLDGLGELLAYGVVVLVAEMLSVLSLIFYGIWLCAKTDQGDVRAVDAESSDLRRLYVIRVFILCKDETLATVRRTISSVKNAYPTEGCERKLYLLDESKDDAKRDYFMGPKSGTDVIYIAPPVRPEGTKKTNWRSEIMNFTLSLIYPAADEEGYKNISISELTCVLGADQTCSSSFFVSLLRYIDSGDDVAAAICPRICYNVDPDCDIFDLQRVAYYEKTQLGMDAYGFTACMYTNMLLRSRALQEVGWFPNETLAENWELGMLLRSGGWKSRYVPEYSTIGQSPEEMCECIDEHYRDSRGYFQTFWSGSNPFLCRGLGGFYRLMYASRCFQNFASAVWTPIFTLVPLIQLIFGLWPITFTLEVAVAMIAHYAVRAVMLHYGESFKQMRALWLSRIAVSLFWWADLKASIFVPAKRAIGVGTSFRSRAWSTEAAIRNLKALIIPVGIVVTSLVAFVGGCLGLERVVNLPTVLSLCAAIINFVAPFLLLMHWVFGSGRLLSRACTLLMFVSWAAGVAAFVFLWLLWPREVDFERAADMSLTFLDAQRSGQLPFNYPISWRKDSGEGNVETIFWRNESAKIVIPDRADLSGGYYNDGQIGPVKVTWNIAMTTSMLAWSLIEYKEFWERDEQTKEHAIALLAHGLQYVQQCYKITQVETDGVQQSADFDILFYVVGNSEQEWAQWNRPEDIGQQKQFIGQIALADKPSDLAGQVVAALTSGSLALLKHDKIDRQKTFKFANAAHRLFRSAVYRPGLYLEAVNITDTGLRDVYDSADLGDDLFWGASWLFHASLDGFRSYNLSYYREALKVTMQLAYERIDEPGADINYVNNIALVHAATVTKETQYHLPAQSFIWDWICDREQVKYTRNGRAYFFNSPYLGNTATVASLAALYVKANQDWPFVRDNKALVKGFQCFAAEQARYLLGGQITGYRPHKPFMVGYNDDTYTFTWHRGASCPEYGTAEPCSIAVVTAGLPDRNVITGALLWNPVFDDFPEDARGRNTTVVSLENNMAVPLLYAAVHEQKVSFSECLTLQRSYWLDRAICRKGRPADFHLGPTTAPSRPTPEFEGIFKPRDKEDDRISPPPPPAPESLVPSVG